MRSLFLWGNFFVCGHRLWSTMWSKAILRTLPWGGRGFVWNLRPLQPQDAPSRKIAFFDYFCVLFGPKIVLSCALASTVSAQSESNYGQTCGQNRGGSDCEIFTAKIEENNGKVNIVFINRVTNKMWHGL